MYDQFKDVFVTIQFFISGNIYIFRIFDIQQLYTFTYDVKTKPLIRVYFTFRTCL